VQHGFSFVEKGAEFNFYSDLAPVSTSLSRGRQDAYPTIKISTLWDGRPARPENGARAEFSGKSWKINRFIT
jgi:hypothetical protein